MTVRQIYLTRHVISDVIIFEKGYGLVAVNQ